MRTSKSKRERKRGTGRGAFDLLAQMSHVECNKTGIRSYGANTARRTVAGIRELELDSAPRSDTSSEK